MVILALTTSSNNCVGLGSRRGGQRPARLKWLGGGGGGCTLYSGTHFISSSLFFKIFFATGSPTFWQCSAWTTLQSERRQRGNKSSVADRGVRRGGGYRGAGGRGGGGGGGLTGGTFPPSTQVFPPSELMFPPPPPPRILCEEKAPAPVCCHLYLATSTVDLIC